MDPNDSKEQTPQQPDEEKGPINMEFYRQTRRPRSPSWPYILSAVLMLITLVLLVLFQDRCGDQISDSLFQR